MKQLFIPAFFIVFFLNVNLPAKGSDEDTTFVNDAREDKYCFEDNLDSLLHLYYVHNSPIITEDFLNDSMSNDANIVYIPDSVYISRLSRIPTVVRLTYNQIVRKYIEMYTQRKRDRVQVMLGMAEYYFPIFDDILDYHEIPNEIKCMTIVESALNPRARSRTRAIGLWQFMYGTGKRYGLTINSFVDERCDPIKATHAAARYVKDLYDIYQDWQLVVAAYNCGPGNVNKAIRRAGGKRDFWAIYRFLPRETRGYVPAFIAAVYTMNYYKEHNLIPASISVPLHTDSIMIKHQLHFQQVADILKIPVEQLRDLNPQYIRNIIPARDGLTYSLVLPLTLTSKFIDLQDSIYAYKDSVFFNPKELLKSPDFYTRYYTKYVPSGKYGKIVYTVEEGDNLGFIAQHFNVNINDIREWNDLNGNLIRAGQKLVIYVSEKKIGNEQQKQTVINNTVANTSAQAIIQYNINTTDKNFPGDIIYYTVKYGDTLWDIVKKFPGISQTDLRKWNNLDMEAKLFPGQVLKIMKM
jgi:membrane-bound lytic murein transglycosylase D